MNELYLEIKRKYNEYVKERMKKYEPCLYWNDWLIWYCAVNHIDKKEVFK